jgi:hypothetical protein
MHREGKRRIGNNNNKDELVKDIVKGKKYTRLRAMDIFDNSKDAMLQEITAHVMDGGHGFYQVALMLGEAIAHEEMAAALDSAVEIAMEEVYARLYGDKKKATDFKARLKKDLRGNLNMRALIQNSEMSEAFRKLIQASLD